MNDSSFGAVLWLSYPLPNFLSGHLRGALGSLIPSGRMGSAFMSHEITTCASREVGIF